MCIRSEVGFNLNEEHVELPNREEVGMSPNREEVCMLCEVSDDIDGETELEEENAKTTYKHIK